jgi:hypothetical protein
MRVDIQPATALRARAMKRPQRRAGVAPLVRIKVRL